MELTDELKEWIDSASYETLLRKWRFAPVGDEIFFGESGHYYSDVMFRKKNECDHVGASKRVGWGN